MPSPSSAARPGPEILPGLAAISEDYDAVLCDVWGVIHNGQVGFTAACDALTRFQQTRGPVVLISNSPRPSGSVLPQLRALDVPDEAWSTLITSGDVTRTELAARAPGPTWAVGPDRDLVLYDGLHLDFAGPEDAAFVCCTGLVDDESETPEDYRARLTVAAGRGLELICANPDRVVQRGPLMIPCGGALADLYETLGGTVIMAGKPYPPIYVRALDELQRLAGRPIEPARVLAIGDGLPTDVLGARRMGLDCLFVTDGIHAADIQGPDRQPDRAKLDGLLAAHGAQVRYAVANLVWGR
jgi:HAD superfamily hydrolase (TIGR01459 family)